MYTEINLQICIFSRISGAQIIETAYFWTILQEKQLVRFHFLQENKINPPTCYNFSFFRLAKRKQKIEVINKCLYI